MTENLAGRGEGLAGLVEKWRQSCSVGPLYKEGTVTPVDVREGILRCADQLETAATRERMHQRAVREKVCNLRGLVEASRNGFLNGQPYILTYTDISSELSEIEAALEAAARLPSVGQAPPSTPAKTPVDEPKNDDRAYGCYTCGKQGLKKGQRVSLVYCNECDAKHIEEVRRAALATPSPHPEGTITVNSVTGPNGPFDVPAATQEQPAGSAGWTPSAKDHMDLKEKFNAHIPATDRNHKGPATLDRISGSPRKVGEDGAQPKSEVNDAPKS